MISYPLEDGRLGGLADRIYGPDEHYGVWAAGVPGEFLVTVAGGSGESLTRSEAVGPLALVASGCHHYRLTARGLKPWLVMTADAPGGAARMVNFGPARRLDGGVEVVSRQADVGRPARPRYTSPAHWGGSTDSVHRWGCGGGRPPVEPAPAECADGPAFLPLRQVADRVGDRVVCAVRPVYPRVADPGLSLSEVLWPDRRLTAGDVAVLRAAGVGFGVSGHVLTVAPPRAWVAACAVAADGLTACAVTVGRGGEPRVVLVDCE